jgi:hypothetical protein
MQALGDGHPWAAPAMRDLSRLGSTAVLTLCTTTTFSQGGEPQNASNFS